MNLSRRPTAIDVFAGCGGLTTGLKKAGFRVLEQIGDFVVAIVRADRHRTATQSVQRKMMKDEFRTLIEKYRHAMPGSVARSGILTTAEFHLVSRFVPGP